MFRAGLLWLSEQPRVFRFVRHNGVAKRFAARFVAGESVDSAVSVARDLNAIGLSTSLDLLGESVSRSEEAQHARDSYVDLLEHIRAAGVDANVSVKLTQLGLDIDETLGHGHIAAIVDRARALGNFVRVDMEGSAYTERTLRLFSDRLLPDFGRDHVGVVLQSCLRRTAGDVEAMIGLGARVRLCKGAYQEPAAVAFPDKRDVDASYVSCLERLLAKGHYPGIATHDEAIIAHARAYAQRNGIARDRFEFQMLYGVRRDLQTALRRDGYRVRVYVPFGTQWYPYLMRRLAERPANLAFIVGSLLKESVRRT
jgi:proline dehydrogenase